MRYRISDFESVFSEIERSHELSGKVVYDRIHIDSRKIIHGSRSVFFALKGLRNDGHDYLDEAYEKGVRFFCVETHRSLSRRSDCHYILVRDTTQALQKLARYHRKQQNATIIGITGSNGKTVIKEWLAHILRTENAVCQSPGSYNSQIGVPLSLLRLEEEHEYGVFEAGISQDGEMQALSDMIQCDVGIISNIGDAHSLGFDSIEHKLEEKLKLFTATDMLIYSKDHPLITKALKKRSQERTLSWSLKAHKEADLHFGLSDGYLIAQRTGDKILAVKLGDRSPSYLENLCHTLTTLYYLGSDLRDHTDEIASLEFPAWRLELMEGPNQTTIINDYYNHDFNGLEEALLMLDRKSKENKRVLVFSMMEGQKLSLSEQAEVLSDLLDDVDLDIVLGYRLEAQLEEVFHRHGISVFNHQSKQAIIEHIFYDIPASSTILIKGSRRSRLEDISQGLTASMHRTHLKIDLAAISRNLGFITSKLGPETKVMAMVKASAYGSGVEIAKHLEEERIDHLAVAFVNEGIELRQAGIQAPILVMNVEPDQLHLATQYRLQIQVNDLRLLKALVHSNPKKSKSYEIHINLDTGMHRLGFEKEDLGELIDLLRKNPFIQVVGLMSHLSSADQATQRDFTREQIRLMKKWSLEIQKNLDGRHITRHILNTAGTMNYPEEQMDMVRLGIGLYGISSTPASGLIPCHSLISRIVQIKNIVPGDSVGYGRAYIAKEPITVATVSCGYADGIPRILGRKGYTFRIGNTEAPLIGDICMDFCMIDVTHLKNVHVGDEVCIFGPDKPLIQLSQKAETIPYEILSHIAPRVKRLYTHESR